MTDRPAPKELGRSVFSQRQALGRLPWLALLCLRSRFLRPRLAMMYLRIGWIDCSPGDDIAADADTDCLMRQVMLGPARHVVR